MRLRGKYETTWYTVGSIIGKPVSDWRYIRPSINEKKCCRCGWCSLYCPTSCIKEEGDRFVINLDYCKGCGICARECPVSAITMLNEEEV
jgi:2-oxoacid:acceptor oxidoreductase delta subunit (pyruvate/2-ketoisovalerate family)